MRASPKNIERANFNLNRWAGADASQVFQFYGEMFRFQFFRVKSSPMIDKELLAILACPVCKTPIVQKGEDSLKCNQCRRVYPIKDNIPIMLIDEASIDPA